MKEMGKKKLTKQPEELSDIVYDVQTAQTFIDKTKELYKAVEDAKRNVRYLEKQLEEAQEAVKNAESLVAYQMTKLRKLLPQEFYSRDIDHGWAYPKKYTMRSVKYDNGKIYVKVRWEYKKKPWEGFDPEHIFYLDEFLNLKIGTSYDKANEVWEQRPCPKCCQPMGKSNFTYCCDCVKERQKKIDEFNTKNRRFYCEYDNCIYQIGYTDELTRELGYHGRKFIFKRLDTGDTIETNNLWSKGCPQRGEEVALPKIKFIEGWRDID